MFGGNIIWIFQSIQNMTRYSGNFRTSCRHNVLINGTQVLKSYNYPFSYLLAKYFAASYWNFRPNWTTGYEDEYDKRTGYEIAL